MEICIQENALGFYSLFCIPNHLLQHGTHITDDILCLDPIKVVLISYNQRLWWLLTGYFALSPHKSLIFLFIIFSF